MLKYIIPFQYLYISRLKRMSEVFSLLWIYPMYLVFFLFFLYAVPLYPALVSFLVGIFAWMAVYEIGYLENDAVTVHKEKFPNFRIDNASIDFIQVHFRKLVFFRLILFSMLVGVNFLTDLWTANQCGWFIGWVLLGRLFFFLHNTLRSRINILTYFGLCVTKYVVFPFLFLGLGYGWEPYIVILLTFPILRTTEHAVKPKYGLVHLQRLVGSLDSFRMRYYTVTLVLALGSWVFLNSRPILVLSLAYFFMFRFGIWIMLKWGTYSRELS